MLELGQVPIQRRLQRVAARAVDRSHAAQVAVLLAAQQEVGERELVDGGGAVVEAELRIGHGLDHASRQDHPPQAQAGSERLAGRAAVHDVLGRQALDAADRIAVVAIFGVVVVLHHDRVAPPRPRD
jgi:hypothetical protein